MGILADTSNYKLVNPEEDVLGTTISLEKATQYHEFSGHALLTKKSSIWVKMFITGYNSVRGFVRMYYIVKEGFAKERLEQLRRYTRDIIATTHYGLIPHEEWKPLQEAISNAYLIRKMMEDTNLEDTLKPLVRANSTKSKIVGDLTKLSEFIIEELGPNLGWQLLHKLALDASSPNLYKDFVNHKTENPDDVRMAKKAYLDQLDFQYRVDPFQNNPTARFFNMALAARDDIKRIKKLLNSGSDPTALSLDLASKFGYEVISICDQIDQLINKLDVIATEKVTPDYEKRTYAELERHYLKILRDIIEEEFPTFWFVVDKNSGKIIPSKHIITNKYSDLESFLNYYILKDQFLKSLEKGKNIIKCFNGLSSICPSNCESCRWHNSLINTWKLYKIMSDFSYEDMVKEGLYEYKTRSAILE